jgi:hypothetical protein
MFSLHDMLTRKLAQQTGFAVSVGHLKANPLTGKFLVEKLEIRNPSLFPVGDFLLAPEVRAHVAPGSLLGSRVHVRDLSLHLGQLTGVRAACGSINVAQFRHGLEREERARRSSRSSGRQVRVDNLTLKIDTLVLEDFIGEPARREFPVSIERRFSDIGDPLTLAPFFVQTFADAGLSHAENAIFASMLPDLLWLKIRASLDPSLAHLIAPGEN